MIPFVMHRDDYTASSTTAKYGLGEIRQLPSPARTNADDTTVAAGPRLVRYVQNTGATTLAAGNICSWVASKFNEVVIAPVDSPLSKVAGVALYSIAQNAYGWVQIAGAGEILAGAAGITANTEIKVSGAAAGVGVDSADVDLTIALSIEAGTSGQLTSCIIQIKR